MEGGVGEVGRETISNICKQLFTQDIHHGDIIGDSIASLILVIRTNNNNLLRKVLNEPKEIFFLIFTVVPKKRHISGCVINTFLESKDISFFNESFNTGRLKTGCNSCKTAVYSKYSLR